MKDYAHGDLNPAFRSEVKTTLPNDTSIKSSSLLKASIESSFKPDVLKGVGRIKAVALKVEPKESDVPGLWISSDGDSQPGSDNLIRVRARIVEMHPYPIPTGPDDLEAINLYPIFKAASSDITVEPEYNELIWVDFGNRLTQEDPIYLGPVKNTNRAQTRTSNPVVAITKKALEVLNKPERGDMLESGEPGAPISVSSTGATSFSSDLDKLDFTLGSNELINKWRGMFESNSSRGRRGDPHRVSLNTSDHYAKLTLISMACAEVIEQYWKQKDPSAKVYVTSHFRKRNKLFRKKSWRRANHCGAAIDFNVKIGGKSLTALQVWSGLMKLTESGRIPKGGRGLYLNVGPTGMTSAKLEDAGKPSRSRAPLGGSAGVHYDFRGHYGFFSGKTTPEVVTESRDKVVKSLEWKRSPYAYVWVDTDSDGNDELTDQAAARWLKSNLYSVYKVFKGGWRSYEGTPDVTSAVPNILDILGQTDLDAEDLLVQKKPSEEPT
jgi:hypothetical protein